MADRLSRGEVDYQRHEGSNPMSVVFKLAGA